MAYEKILLAKKDGLATLTFNAPDRLNAVSRKMIAEIKLCWEDLAADSAVRAVLLTGSGRGFCAGADLADPDREASATADSGAALEKYFNPVIRLMRGLPKPIVSAVNGVAAGVGMSFVLASDIAIAAKSASFLQAFARIGLLPDGGSTWFLPRLVGEQRARALAMLAPQIPAEQAKEWGLIWDVVEDGELMTTATELARRLAEGPSMSLSRIKEAMNRASKNDLGQQLDVERDFQREAAARISRKASRPSLPSASPSSRASRGETTMTTPHKEITSGLKFPEGPVAMPDGSVILVEIARQTLTRVMPDGKQHVIARLGGGPNGAAMGPKGKIYVTNNGGFNWIERPGGRLFPGTVSADYKGGSIQVVDPETGKFETLYHSCDGRKLNGPNDLVFDDAGGFWFTDLGKTRERDNDRGAVYYAKADGSKIEEKVFPLERPNGCGLSPDEKTLYVVETPTARCWAFELSAPGVIKDANGPYRGEKGRVIAGLGGYQMFDSLAVDSAGHICVATLITGAVSDISPDGKSVVQYKLPDPMVTNVCFGAADLRTAFATLSMTGKLVSFEWPRPGLKLEYLNK